nr:hypothetical protein Iba_chr13eCG12850 [Ipomoea batatas]
MLRPIIPISISVTTSSAPAAAYPPSIAAPIASDHRLRRLLFMTSLALLHLLCSQPRVPKHQNPILLPHHPLHFFFLRNPADLEMSSGLTAMAMNGSSVVLGLKSF